jgi:molybdopterin converting factor small subunit
MASVRVEIRYLGALRDRAGHRQEEVDFPAGTTLSDIARWLSDSYQIAAPGSQAMAILNGRGWGQLPLKLGTEVRDGDVICLFPPIAGG